MAEQLSEIVKWKFPCWPRDALTKQIVTLLENVSDDAKIPSRDMQIKMDDGSMFPIASFILTIPAKDENDDPIPGSAREERLAILNDAMLEMRKISNLHVISDPNPTGMSVSVNGTVEAVRQAMNLDCVSMITADGPMLKKDSRRIQ